MLKSEKRTLGDQTYERLLAGICDLTYPPGHKLSEAQVAQAFGVSRAPVRDAFLRLERHGFVRIIPQVGTIVRSIDLKRARDICQLRMVLESFAARKAAEAIDDAQKRALYTRFTLLMQIQDDAAFREAIASVDMFLHDLVLQLCCNEEILRVIHQCKPVIECIRNTNAEWGNRRATRAREQRQIAAALLRSDPDAAEAAMAAHIRSIQTTIEQLMEKRLAYC